MHSVRPLDEALPWYVRFITTTATSAGFPAKDCRINLYDFSAICEPEEPEWSFVHMTDTHIGMWPEAILEDLLQP